MHEASLHTLNCFITLTYDNEHLPEMGTLVKKDFQDFMKRFRKEFVYAPDYTAVSDFRLGSVARIRFFHCGEYGERFGRPHYHACIFGFDFPDKVYLGKRGEFPVWRSSSLERLWSMGRSEIGSVSFESAAYVARYVLKKATGPLAKERYERVNIRTGEIGYLQPEYCTMSRRPGVGGEWLDRFSGEVFPSDSVLVRGRLVKPPRYYDSRFELVSPEVVAAVKAERKAGQLAVRYSEKSPLKLRVKRIVREAQVNLFGRGLE